MATYNEKLEDSFATKLRMFLFVKTLTEDSLSEYLEKPEVQNTVIADFENFNKSTLTNELSILFSGTYFNNPNNVEITIDGVSKFTADIQEILKKDGYKYFSKDKQKELISREIYLKLKEIYEKSYEKIMTKEEFEKLNAYKTCSYCGISTDTITKLKNTNSIFSKSGRGAKLEIDRKRSNLEYSFENCCMSCYWCNNAKTDEYTAQEFKPIARGINQAWNDRLKKAGINETICFPENSKVWEQDS